MFKLKFKGVFVLWLIMVCLTVRNIVGTRGMSGKLFKLGIRLNIALEKQIHYMDLHITTMERSFMRILAENTYNNTKEDYISTSVSALTMVRRLAEDWTALAGMVRGLTSESLTSRVGNVRWPTGEDLEAATKAVTRGQIIYSLETDILSQGSVDNITFFAETTGMPEECKRLMINILRTYPRSTTPQDLIVQYYNVSLKDTDTLIDTANYLKNINDFGEKDEDERVETLGRLCRGETKIDSKLRCRYVHYGQPHLRFQPFKLEELQWEPPVLRFYDAITDLEAETLKKDALKVMKPSQTFDSKGRKNTNDFRNSFLAWIYVEYSEVARRMVPRMSDMTRLDVNYAEPHQISSYALSGGYRPHKDYLERYFQYDRLATLMYYLTEVKQGGNTVFLEWDLSVPPVKNSAILWFNYRPDGNLQDNSVHSGCPVLQGRKWVLNKWISNWGGLPCADNYTKSYKNYYIE